MNYPELEKLINVIKQLRDPQKGCPWDLEQDHHSLLPFLIEESHEFIHAVESNQIDEMKDELGDVFLQVLLHSTIAEQNNSFNLEDVAKAQAEKLIRRHPHVFSNPDQKSHSIEEIKQAWKSIKALEAKTNPKKDHSDEAPISKEVLAKPSLMSSITIGKKSTDYHFDWDSYSQVSYKVEEEWQELKEELMPTTPNIERVEEELGDLLFSICQLARHLKLDPEATLRKANYKFASRFNEMIKIVKSKGLDPQEMTQEQLDQYWLQVK